MSSLLPTDRQRRALGPGLEAPDVHAALQHLAEDPEVESLTLFGSRARDEARPDRECLLALIQQLRTELEARLEEQRSTPRSDG